MNLNGFALVNGQLMKEIDESGYKYLGGRGDE